MPNVNRMVKTSAEVERIGLDYTNILANDIQSSDTLSTSAWASSPSGLTLASDTIDQSSTRATVLVSGGTDAIDYTLTNTVVTAAGRTLVGKYVVRVRD